MKILFTSVGRRVELVQAFKKAAQELNIDLTGNGIVTCFKLEQFRFLRMHFQTVLI